MAQTTDLYVRMKAAVVEKLERLNLTDAQSRIFSVIDLNLGADNVEYPCIACVTAGLSDELSEFASTEYEHYMLPVGVMILDRDNIRANEIVETPFLTTRKTIIDAFHNKALSPDATVTPAITGCAEVWRCFVVPRMMFDNRLPQYQMVRSSLLIKVYARELRDDS